MDETTAATLASAVRWSGWSSRARAFRGLHVTPADGGTWERGLRPFLEYRDLQLGAATSGHFGAAHIRVVPRRERYVDWHCHDVDFQLFFLLQGSLTIETQDREEVVLSAGDAGCVPRRYWHREYDFSDDCEIAMVSSPADLKTLSAQPPGGFDRSLVAKYSVGPQSEASDPRGFSRDLGGDEITEGRISTVVVRVDGGPSAEARRHASNCRWMMILAGTTFIESDDKQPVQLHLHDSMSLGWEQRVRQVAGPAGYVALEVAVQPEPAVE